MQARLALNSKPGPYCSSAEITNIHNHLSSIINILIHIIINNDAIINQYINIFILMIENKYVNN